MLTKSRVPSDPVQQLVSDFFYIYDFVILHNDNPEGNNNPLRAIT